MFQTEKQELAGHDTYDEEISLGDKGTRRQDLHLIIVLLNDYGHYMLPLL